MPHLVVIRLYFINLFQLTTQTLTTLPHKYNKFLLYYEWKEVQDALRGFLQLMNRDLIELFTTIKINHIS